MKNSLEWKVNLCKANKKIMQLSREEIQKIVDEYPTIRKITDLLLPRYDYQKAEYNMACRFVKKY
ncbi:MAG: hypothetical protein WC781_00010 [Candidatus Pacearchaeota archaeon]|jgi:hypothetical protein